MTKKPYHLVTIKFSHYNEKARWALDRFGVDYSESAHLPLLHYPAVFFTNHFLNSSDSVSTRGSTPVLSTPHSILGDSSDILRYVSATFSDAATSLYPNAEAHRLEQQFSLLGDHTRRIAYFYTLSDHHLCIRLAELNVPGIEATLWRWLFPVVRFLLREALRAKPERALKSKAVVEAQFRSVSEQLNDGKRYLCGNQFTAADIAFACMAAPALLVEQPEGYSARLPYRQEVPPEFAQWANQLRQTPAGQFALRLFREERSS